MTTDYNVYELDSQMRITGFKTSGKTYLGIALDDDREIDEIRATKLVGHRV